MGNKTWPSAIRVGVNKDWVSRWHTADKVTFGKWVAEDEKIRALLLSKKYNSAQISSIEIERKTQAKKDVISVYVVCGQIGALLGKEGAIQKEITLEINKIVGRKTKVQFSPLLAANVNLSARVIAREIADAIENRVSYRNAQKAAIRKVMASKGLGIRTSVGGRLNGVEMARTEGYREGVINTYTIRSDVDFAIEKAWTTTGIIGVKVWINRGENFGLELRRPSTTDKAIQTPGQTNSRGNNDNYHNRPRQYAPKGGEK